MSPRKVRVVIEDDERGEDCVHLAASDRQGGETFCGLGCDEDVAYAVARHVKVTCMVCIAMWQHAQSYSKGDFAL